MINNLQSILTQDPAATSHPIFCVYSKQEVVVDPDYSYDKCFYVKQTSDDYPQISTEEYDELTAAYNKATDYRTFDFNSKGEQIDYPMPEDPCSDGDFDPDDWTLVYVRLVDKFEQAFFIRQNAEDFIERNRHNLCSPFVYVESGYRNPEWQQIREILISAAKKNENSFGELKFGLKYEDVDDGMFVVYSELPISNYANSLKRIWKIESGWKEQTLAVEWKGEYQESENIWDCWHKWIWDEKRYAPVDYDGKTPPVEFMNKVLPLTIKGEQDT